IKVLDFKVSHFRVVAADLHGGGGSGYGWWWRRSGIYLDGVWCDVPDQIKKAVVDHFSSRFKECDLNKPCFNSPLFHNLSSSDASYLESNISLNEIKAAVWDCDGSKVPGPDGFNFKFIRAYWEILKNDFLICIKHFENTGKLAKGCNSSFVAFIPKKADPLGFSNYRPISLIRCVYKVISKIIVARLAKVISSIIGPNQTTFIAGRQILDSCLVANELIHMAKIENQNLMIFKVDFVKDFDTSISILVNGSPSAEFKMEREGTNISLLQYADDALFFGEWSRLNARNLILVLKCFEKASGLKINLSKSRIFGIGIPNVEVEEIASSLGCLLIVS
ncbi:RNA-directed DNA polymerase, eukaryota, partial [Tanacetum coccineum]